eukprot:9467015-Pyramimonas_sp.AAC.1
MKYVAYGLVSATLMDQTGCGAGRRSGPLTCAWSHSIAQAGLSYRIFCRPLEATPSSPPKSCTCMGLTE